MRILSLSVTIAFFFIKAICYFIKIYRLYIDIKYQPMESFNITIYPKRKFLLIKNLPFDLVYEKALFLFLNILAKLIAKDVLLL